MNATQKIAEIYKQMRLDEAKKKMDPVGKADADIDNDGDVDSSDEYLHNRRKAIKKSMKEEKCEDCGCDPCECDDDEDEDEMDEASCKTKKEAVSIDPDDGEVTKAKDANKKKKKSSDTETSGMNEGAEAVARQASSMVKKGKASDFRSAVLKVVNNMTDLDIKKRQKLRNDAIAWAQKANNGPKRESVEEAALTVGMKQPVHIDDTEEKGHMDAVKATKAGPAKAKENKAKKLKELRK